MKLLEFSSAGNLKKTEKVAYPIQRLNIDLTATLAAALAASAATYTLDAVKTCVDVFQYLFITVTRRNSRVGATENLIERRKLTEILEADALVNKTHSVLQLNDARTQVKLKGTIELNKTFNIDVTGDSYLEITIEKEGGSDTLACDVYGRTAFQNGKFRSKYDTVNIIANSPNRFSVDPSAVAMFIDKDVTKLSYKSKSGVEVEASVEEREFDTQDDLQLAYMYEGGAFGPVYLHMLLLHEDIYEVKVDTDEESTAYFLKVNQ